MKYSIEIGKIVEGALKHDQVKVKSYTQKLINSLLEDNETKAANKLTKILDVSNVGTLSYMGMGKENNIPVDMESRNSLVDVIYPTDNDIDVVLSQNNYNKLQSFILGYKNVDKLNALGIGISNTLLLYGPPGCGKTKSAYLVAKELDLPLVIARLDSLISSYLGTTAKNIRAIFEYVQKMPCVLFLDEFDAIAKARNDNNELGELKRVVNSLLQNIDAISKDSLVIAATNHDGLLDTAVWRRFDYKIEIELPDIDAIIKMQKLFLGDNLLLKDKEFKELAYAFLGLSGASIEEIIKKSFRNAVIYDREFTKTSIYNELFIFKDIVSKNIESDRELLKKKARYLRNCNNKIFSYSVIANILQISKTTAANLISEEDK